MTRETDAVVLRCLEFDPARRFRSAVELLEALAGAEAGAHRPPPGEGVLEQARKQAADGDPAGACHTLRTFLDAGSGDLPPAVRLTLLTELARLLDTQGDSMRLGAAARGRLATGARQRPPADPAGALRPAVAYGRHLPAGRERLPGDLLRRPPATRERQGVRSG